MYDKHFKYGLSQFEKGVPLKEALGSNSFMEGFGSALKNLFMPIKVEEEGGEKKPVNPEEVSAIKRKIAERIYPTNIRIIVSGNSRPEAEKILGEIESSLHQFSKQHENSFTLVRLEKGAFSKLTRDFSFRMFSEDTVCPLNGKEIAITGDLVSDAQGHSGTVSGSHCSVKINNKVIIIEGDSVSCGDTMTSSSSVSVS